jgi:hypothetical protein
MMDTPNRGPWLNDTAVSSLVGEVEALRAELDAAHAKLSRFREAVEAGHVPSALSDLYPEDNVRFCDLDNERWPCTAACPTPEG